MIGGLLVLFMVLATAPVLMRVACQLKVHRRLFWDDFWIIFACVLMDGASAVNHYGNSDRTILSNLKLMAPFQVCRRD